MKATYALCLLLLASLGLAVAPGWAQPRHHEGDLIIGWTDLDAGGSAVAPTLAVEFGEDHAGFDEQHALSPVHGPLWGWLGGEPGFEALETDEPDEHLFTLTPGADVMFEVVALDPGLNIWLPGFGGQLGVGDTHSLGGYDLHSHLAWHIDSTVPGVDPVLYTYSATFRLLDSGTTGYLPTGDYTLTFVPEPTSGLLLVTTLLIFRRR